jgi:hypothetical protein
MKITLNLKENDKKRSKSDPERKADETFLVTLFQVHYMEQFHQFLQCKQLKYESVQIRQLLREENKLKTLK